MNSLRIGLDFGSFGYRAAYLTGDEIITVPTSPDNSAWRGMIVVQPTPDTQPLGLAFKSLKYCLGDGRPVILGGASQLAEDVVYDILHKIYQTVTTYAGEDIAQAVLAIPARYSAFRRAALRQVAQAAGFKQVDLINDCTAAALSHTWGRPQPGTLLVFSMGFHGFECGLVRYVRQQIRELAHDGDEHPAGRDIDLQIMGAILDTLEQNQIKVPIRVWTGPHWFELRAIAEDVKERLTNDDQAELEIPPYLTNAAPARIVLSRHMLDRVVEPAIEGALKVVERTLEEAGLTPDDIDEVLLVGGSTRLGVVQKRLEAMFGHKLVQPRDDLLARGAAIQASRLEEQALAQANALPVETAPPNLPVRPDLETVFAYAQQLVAQDQAEAARAFLEELQARAGELLVRLPTR